MVTSKYWRVRHCGGAVGAASGQKAVVQRTFALTASPPVHVAAVTGLHYVQIRVGGP
jgi:hypothetical protein